MNTFIRQLPKAELHLHLEGTLEPEMMLDLAERNGISLPYGNIEDVRRAYRFTDLQSFLDLYYQGANVLRTEDDFYRLTLAYLEKAAAQNIRHVEMMFDLQTHTTRDIGTETVLNGINRAREEADHISSQLILCFLRHSSPRSAMETLQAALPYKSSILAVGLDSSEAGFPPELFQEVFDTARAEGFLTVAHAGEEGPPEYIYQAIELLKVRRIDHGVRCIENPELIALMEKKQIPLTVCPLSNVKLRVFDSLQDKRFRQLMATDLLLTLNSDDPAYFGGYLEENFLAVAEALHLDHQAIAKLAAAGFKASFLPRDTRNQYLEQISNQLNNQ